jgi:hypothetical protein
MAFEDRQPLVQRVDQPDMPCESMHRADAAAGDRLRALGHLVVHRARAQLRPAPRSRLAPTLDLPEPPTDPPLLRLQPTSYGSVHLKSSSLFVLQPNNVGLFRINPTRPLFWVFSR